MILFRLDGNAYIGLGHVMRCLSLADALRKYGFKITFVLADSFCEDIISQRGYSSVVLQTNYSLMEDELNKFVPIITNVNPTFIIVDSYFVTELYLKTLKGLLTTVYIDDLLKFPYPVDILINYNLFSDLSDYKTLYRGVSNQPEFLLGTKYVPLRREFSNIPIKEQPEVANKVLIMTGGADSYHVSLSLFEYIMHHSELWEKFYFTFVIGAANMDYNKIVSLSKNIPNVSVLRNVQNMAQIMMQNDIAVSAAGSTLYELCACGIPTITYSLADNQIPAAELFEEKGIMLNAGDIRESNTFADVMFGLVNDLAFNYSLRNNLIHSMPSVTDGKGAIYLSERLISIINCCGE